MNIVIIYLLSNTMLFFALIHYMEYFLLLSHISFPLRFSYTLAVCVILTPLELICPLAACLVWLLLPFLYVFAHTLQFPKCLALPIGFLLLFGVQVPLGLLLFRTLSAAFPFMSNALMCAFAFFLCCIIFFLMLQELFLFLKNRQTAFPPILRILLSTIPTLSVLIYLTIALMALREKGLLFSILGLSIICMVTISSLIHLTVVEKFREILASEHQNELIVQEAHLKEDYYREIEQSTQEIRRIKHDLRNQLSGLYDSLNDGNSMLQEKLTALLGGLEDTGNRIYTSNEILNSILKLKFSEAEKKGICLEHDIMVPRQIKMEYGDMGILFGNLLDNAIEACAKIPEEQRWLRLTVNYASGGLVLIVENSKDAEDDVDLVSRKKHPTEHGIGIKSVRKIVEKYDGAIEFIDEAGRFEASAIIYGLSGQL